MLSSEGNENGEKTTIGLISKKATLHVQHTLFLHFFAVVLQDYNVKLPETSQLHVFWRTCRIRVLVHFFSLPLIFTLHWWPLAFLMLLPPLQNFHVVLLTKKCLLCLFVCLFFISRSKSLSPFLSLTFADLPPTFSFFLFLHIPNLWT